MMMVFRWMKIDKEVCGVIERMIGLWKTKLYIKNEKGERVVSRQIRILRGFLQGDSFSPVGFCLTEVPIGILLNDAPGYRMGEPGNRVCKRIHGLFVDDLKVYGDNHKKLEVTNETIVKASTDVGAAYGVSKAVFERGVIKKGEGLDVGRKT